MGVLVCWLSLEMLASPLASCRGPAYVLASTLPHAGRSLTGIDADIGYDLPEACCPRADLMLIIRFKQACWAPSSWHLRPRA